MHGAGALEAKGIRGKHKGEGGNRVGISTCSQMGRQMHQTVFHRQQDSVTSSKHKTGEGDVYWMPQGTRLDGRSDELREGTVSLGTASTLPCIPAIVPDSLLVPQCQEV